MLKYFFVTALTFLSFIFFAQTGPAGVGNSANNVFWLKADKGIPVNTNNSPISSWADQSGNGINMSQTVTAQQPSFATNVINGYPAVQFDNVSSAGLNDKMIGPDSPVLDNTSGYSFFTVTRPQNFGDAHVIVSKRTTVSVDQSFMLFYYTSNKLNIDIQTTNDRFNSTAAFSTNTNYIIDVFYDGTIANPRCAVYLGESLDVSANETSTIVPDNASPIILGTTDASDPRPYGGYMSEIIIYREALVPAKRIIVNNYLSAKYNIALSANDKYTGDSPGNGDYDKEVAGVGKESTGNNNSFSTSISGGIGITAVSGLDNTDYLLTGHAVDVNALNTTDVGGMTGTNNARWLRIWYFDITNTSTSINADIQFGATDGGMGSAPLGTTVSDYVLLYRAGQSGNWTELATASSVAGDRVFFNGISLSSDGYYTLGSKNSTISVLPIELTTFDAAIDGNKVALKWATASEKNNAFFTVEKTKDGDNFITIITLKGAGSSLSYRDYAAEDVSPYKGLSYYRLKQTDVSGNSSYSKLQAVYYETEIEDLSIYPNPSTRIFYIRSKAFEDSKIQIRMIDGLGKTCFTGTFLPDKNIISVDTENKLLKGSYSIVIATEDRTYIRKIIFD